jgi:hypothetical protein
VVLNLLLLLLLLLGLLLQHVASRAAAHTPPAGDCAGATAAWRK